MAWRTWALEPSDVLFYQFGPLSLKPQLSLSEVYNDNVFYLPNNAVDDFITTISPGLKLQLGKLEKNYILLTYNMDQLFYINNPRLDSPQHRIEIRDRLQGPHLSLTGSDRIQLLSSPLGGVERVLTLRNIDQDLFNDTYTLAYDISEKSAAYIRGSHDEVDYQPGVQLYSLEALNGTVGFGYRPFAKTSFFGEMYYSQTTTTPNSPTLPINPRLDAFGGYVGARGEFTEKLSGTVKVGYELRQFSDGTTAPSDPVVDLALTQRFSEKTSLSINYSRQNNVSVQYAKQPYTADLVGFQLVQGLGFSGKWQATVSGSYSLYDYSAIGNVASIQYNYIRASASLGYKIQLWMTASLGYEYESVTSDVRGAVDYAVNRVTLRLAIGF
jgi:hypothetical protein